MDILKDNTMPIPSQQPSGWNEVLKMITDVTPWAAVTALLWKGIDKVFKYFSDARDAELRRIVHDEMNPSIKELTESIKELRESIWEMKRKP